jgi:hypothetical protein
MHAEKHMLLRLPAKSPKRVRTSISKAPAVMMDATAAVLSATLLHLRRHV